MCCKYSLNELQKIAEELAQRVVDPHVILLTGNLGAGKTTFTKFFIKSISDNITVTSPTFNIINTYETRKGIIWHADLYRLNNINELEPLGLLDFIYSCISIIEWPNIIKPYLKDINITEINL